MNETFYSKAFKKSIIFLCMSGLCSGKIGMQRNTSDCTKIVIPVQN